MACRKCKSDWVGLRGRDCNSCPHCSKVQRCIERKRGRWIDQHETKLCKQCGSEFTCKVIAGSRCPQVYCSRKCRTLGKAEWRRQWRAGYTQGVRRQRQERAKKPRPVCKHCGQQFKRQQGSNSSNIYCSKPCFFAARANGTQAWDKTNIRKSCWHLMGPYSSAPSVTAMRAIAKCWRHVFKCQNLFSDMALRYVRQSKCEVCGSPCKGGASRFCSYACNKKWRGERRCRCGAVVANCSAFSRPSCKGCKRESARIHKRLYGCYRRRCRTYGGHFNSGVKPKDIFARDRWRCHVCNRKTQKIFRNDDPLSATVDHHPIPLSKGGDHDWHNVRCACKRCNELKGNKWDGQRRLRFV